MTFRVFNSTLHKATGLKTASGLALLVAGGIAAPALGQYDQPIAQPNVQVGVPTVEAPTLEIGYAAPFNPQVLSTTYAPTGYAGTTAIGGHGTYAAYQAALTAGGHGTAVGHDYSAGYHGVATHGNDAGGNIKTATGHSYAGHRQSAARANIGGIQFSAHATSDFFVQTNQEIVTPLLDVNFSGVAEATIIEDDTGIKTDSVTLIPTGDNSLASIVLNAETAGSGLAIADFSDAEGNSEKVHYDSSDQTLLGLEVGDAYTEYTAESSAYAQVLVPLSTITGGYSSHALLGKSAHLALQGGVHFDHANSNSAAFSGSAVLKSRYLDIELGNLANILANVFKATSVGLTGVDEKVVPYGDGFDHVDMASDYSFMARAKYESDALPLAMALAGQISSEKDWSVTAASTMKLPFNRDYLEVSATGFLDSTKAYGGRVDASYVSANRMHGLAWASSYFDADKERVLQAGLGGGYGGMSLTADWTRYSTDKLEADFDFTGGGVYSLIHHANKPIFHIDSYGLKARYDYHEKASVEIGGAREVSDLFGHRNVLSTKVAIKL